MIFAASLDKTTEQKLWIKSIYIRFDGGVLDTAKYHYLVWQKIANELNIEFTLEHNELLKG
jgi:beta-phosphoglucomutase